MSSISLSLLRNVICCIFRNRSSKWSRCTLVIGSMSTLSKWWSILLNMDLLIRKLISSILGCWTWRSKNYYCLKNISIRKRWGKQQVRRSSVSLILEPTFHRSVWSILSIFMIMIWSRSTRIRSKMRDWISNSFRDKAILTSVMRILTISVFLVFSIALMVGKSMVSLWSVNRLWKMWWWWSIFLQTLKMSIWTLCRFLTSSMRLRSCSIKRTIYFLTNSNKY